MDLKSLRRKINFFSTTVEKLGHTELAFELKLEQLALNFCYENKCKIAIRSYYKFLLNVLLYEEETATIYNSSIFEEVPIATKNVYILPILTNDTKCIGVISIENRG